MNYLVLVFLYLSFGAFSISAQIAEKAEDISPLLVGETIPDFELKASDGSADIVLNIIREKPTVLLIYRGGWCPFCNLHLSEIQGVQNEVVDLGYKIIAISPDSPENIRSTDDEHELSYTLYSDSDGKFIEAMGLAFKAPDKYSGMLSERSNGLNNGLLPVPSVFVVDTSGKILFEYINPDYKTRISAGLLLAVLYELKKD
ncbi:MAG: AhpC/TSA family protein [Melioribacteraceae bacterium]|nr:AhpC/TSA family protein [Melioribacteraceae bacterium]MCF8356588.1 AhpC/TSA family protein [Melioribacteraceae bacterium]MCF8395973.1 AhpC/TSA family protein [Melioribacteraceae bacterium]MCF8421024.1 AhpC/TSA family protein [Melioribacteraceae bacterium]